MEYNYSLSERYKALTEKEKLDSAFIDGRTKLLPCQRVMIQYWREQGKSQNEIAKIFHVSKRTIQFILNPGSHTENLKRREERGGSKVYYNREKHSAAIKKHRKKKDDILKETTKKKSDEQRRNKQ